MRRVRAGPSVILPRTVRLCNANALAQAPPHMNRDTDQHTDGDEHATGVDEQGAVQARRVAVLPLSRGSDRRKP